jgi:hypothetical protein
MKVQRIDFGAAKLFVAERLHRDDLIKTKGEGGTGQRQDPQSLLNPPIDNLDNGFPYLYLGARLEVEIDQIPPPSTKMVGIASLPYYDSPARNGKSAKPVLVGPWPCIVFETIAADGRSHAHRIYVSADGLGKAELGQDAAGSSATPRNRHRANRDSRALSVPAGVRRLSGARQQNLRAERQALDGARSRGQKPAKDEPRSNSSQTAGADCQGNAARSGVGLIRLGLVCPV